MANQIPELLDPVKFARQGESVSGPIKLSELPRIVARLMPDQVEDNDATTDNNVVSEGAVLFELNFSLKGRAAVAKGSFTTEVSMLCQRCLEQMSIPLSGDIALEFISGESAESSLEEGQYDVVNYTAETINLRELIEDELILALPFAPMHEEDECQATQKIKDLQSEQAQDKAKDNPFTVLAELKKNQES